MAAVARAVAHRVEHLAVVGQYLARRGLYGLPGVGVIVRQRAFYAVRLRAAALVADRPALARVVRRHRARGDGLRLAGLDVRVADLGRHDAPDVFLDVQGDFVARTDAEMFAVFRPM